MESKKKSKNNFLKTNAYYLVLAFVIFAVVALTVTLFIRQNALDQTINSSQNGNLVERPNDNSSAILPNDNSSTPSEDNKPNENPEPEKPTQTVVSFIFPVENATVTCDYTDSSVVYNKTLNLYTGHCAVDFGAETGSEVKVVFAGRIESVTTSYLKGTTVTVDHGNGLKTVYNGIEVVDGVEAGLEVQQGFIVGYVSDNNRQEYKDGPHLHFEVWENGEKVSPYKYLEVNEK